LNTVLQQNWQIYAMAVIVGFATVMVMRWWRYRRASGGGDSALLSIVLNNMTQNVILSLHRDVRRFARCRETRVHAAGPHRK
jgi:hypothetical protein